MKEKFRFALFSVRHRTVWSLISEIIPSPQQSADQRHILRPDETSTPDMKRTSLVTLIPSLFASKRFAWYKTISFGVFLRRACLGIFSSIVQSTKFSSSILSILKQTWSISLKQVYTVNYLVVKLILFWWTIEGSNL